MASPAGPRAGRVAGPICSLGVREEMRAYALVHPAHPRASILEQLLKAVAPLKTLPDALDDLRAADEASDALPPGVIGGTMQNKIYCN